MMMKLEIVILNFSRTERENKEKSKIRVFFSVGKRIEEKKNLTHIQAIAVSDFHFLFDLLVK